MQWTPELKAEVIERYTSASPTAENSVEIIKDIAEQLEASANGVRMVLVQAGVYVKKDAAASKETKKATGNGASTGTKRVSKEDSIAELRAAIEESGKTVDEDILTKLTGKAAVYFLSLIKG